MEIPNPYRGNYKVLVLVPLLLVAISLFFIPQIKQGVDFRGGTLVTMQASAGMDEAALSHQFIVVPSRLEFVDPHLRRDDLKRLADATGGRYFDVHQVAEIPGVIERLKTLAADPQLQKQLRALAEAFLAETSDEWETGKIYLNLENQTQPSV